MIDLAVAALIQGQIEANQLCDLLARSLTGIHCEQKAPTIEVPPSPPREWPGRFDLLRQADHPTPKDPQ